MGISEHILKKLANKALVLASANPNEIEKCCWMVVHEYRHGVMPVEYDIRDIDEELFLAVLACAKTKY